MVRPATPTTSRDLKDGRVRLELWIDRDLKDRLRRESFDTGEPISSIVARLIRQGLDGKEG